MAASILSSSWPARPTNGLPSRSSSRPGASPISISARLGRAAIKTQVLGRRLEAAAVEGRQGASRSSQVTGGAGGASCRHDGCVRQHGGKGPRHAAEGRRRWRRARRQVWGPGRRGWLGLARRRWRGGRRCRRGRPWCCRPQAELVPRGHIAPSEPIDGRLRRRASSTPMSRYQSSRAASSAWWRVSVHGRNLCQPAAICSKALRAQRPTLDAAGRPRPIEPASDGLGKNADGARGCSESRPREAMEFDVVIVGAGPAGLAAAIRLKQLAANGRQGAVGCRAGEGLRGRRAHPVGRRHRSDRPQCARFPTGRPRARPSRRR